MQLNTRWEDAQHLLLDCPMYSSIRASRTSLFQPTRSVADLLISVNQMHVVNSSGLVFLSGVVYWLDGFAWTELFVLALSWPQAQ